MDIPLESRTADLDDVPKQECRGNGQAKTFFKRRRILEARVPDRLVWARKQSTLLHAELEERIGIETAKLRAEGQRERDQIKLFQQSLLLTLPASPLLGLAVETASQVCLPEALVGGDFADVVPLGENQVALILGDICGKGIAAALCVPQTLYALRLILRECPDPAQALSRLNHYLVGSNLPAYCGFVALSLAVIDAGTGRVVCACAGSEPPLILRAGAGAEAVNAGNIALGVKDDQAYQAVEFLLDEDDALLLVTDGITEAQRQNSDGGKDLLCYEGFMELAQEAFRRDTSTKQIAQAVLHGATEFAGGKLHDDACVLIAARQPRTESSTGTFTHGYSQ